MLRSVETYALRRKVGDVRALSLIREAGFEAFDYSFYWLSSDHPMCRESYLDYAKTIRAEADRLGLVCRQAHAPFEMTFGDSFEESNEHFRGIVRSMEAAALLGAKRIVVHALNIPQEYGHIDTVAYNAEFYRSLLPFCERFDIKIAVENLFVSDKKSGCYRGLLGTPEELCAVIHRVGSPYLCACVDLGHASLTGIEPEYFIRRMDTSVLECLHIQDTDYKKDLHTLPFGGNLNWDGVLSALRDTHYSGDVNFEIYGFLSPLPEELLPSALRYAADLGAYFCQQL